MKERLVLKDGSIGVSLGQSDAGKAAPFYELLNLESPQDVLKLHEEYLDAGAEIITTNSFSAHPHALNEWGYEEKAFEINYQAAKLARKAVDDSGKTAWIAGSLGPTAASLTLCSGNTDFKRMKDGYKLEAKALLDGGADFLMIETIHDPLNAKAAWIGILELIDEENYKTEIALSLTVELTGASLSGQSIASFVVSTTHLNPLFLGLNCSLGPQSLYHPVMELSRLSPYPVSLVPNAGLPDERGNYILEPKLFTEQMSKYLEKGYLNILGGCCGTTPEHIRELGKALKLFKTRDVRGSVAGHIAGLDAVSLKQEPSPMLVGERANTLGSRKFKKHAHDGNTQKVIEVLRAQDTGGAHALDICLASTEKDENDLWRTFASSFKGIIKPPVFIDTTSNDVVKTALEFLPGKPVINSVNLEDGGERILELAKLKRYHPMSVVAGLIDENGMAKTYDEKLLIADKIHSFLCENGFTADEIIIDPLVFPLTTDIHPYDTIKAIGAIKEKFPDSAITLGISNISFGLPPKTRSIINSVYIQMALKAGLDIAIVNVNHLARVDSISKEDLELANKILKEFDKEALQELIDKYRGVKLESKEDLLAGLEPTKRIETRIVNGIRDGLSEEIDGLLDKMKPIDIINGPLVSGMNSVGELFSDGRLIISEVLLSAEVFKSAMDKLLPHIEKSSLPKAGKVVLATVKGDVHDIGRNLVGMILESHGFEVIDLGCKVSPEVIIESIRKENPIAVGLSGLLIRSAYIMKETVEAFEQAGIIVPVVVGGAALSKEFTAREIVPAYPNGRLVKYVKDVIESLHVFSAIAAGDDIPADILKPKMTSQKSAQEYPAQKITSVTPPHIPDFETHIIKSVPIDDLVPLINWKMLIHKHLGARMAKKEDAKSQIDKALNKALTEGIFKPKSIFRFFEVTSENDELVVKIHDKKHRKIKFARSQKGICATDWINNDSKITDSVAIFVVTAGDISDAVNEAKEGNDLFFSYAIQSLSLEFAEACAEYTHRVIRNLWGLEDEDRGVRLSPGYPACPDLTIQKTIFEILKPEKIGVNLTDGMMMEPEDSVSAIVIHHPDGVYY